MRQIYVVFLALILSGCVSMPSSNSPSPRFYAFSAVEENQVGKKINIPVPMMVGIGPVKIPEYLNRPQMVTRDKNKMLQFAQFDRWGDSLDLGMARLVREDLTVIIPKAQVTLYPWNPLMGVKYQVIIELVDLDSQLDGDMSLVAQWMIIDLQNSKQMMIKRSAFHTAIIPQNYSGLAKTFSASCLSLSTQIAQALKTLQIQKKV